MVAVCRNAGMSTQAAYDHMGDLLKQRYRDWYLALAALPSWGREIDAEVQQYIEGVKRVVQANLHWRYMKKVPNIPGDHCLTFPI